MFIISRTYVRSLVGIAASAILVACSSPRELHPGEAYALRPASRGTPCAGSPDDIGVFDEKSEAEIGRILLARGGAVLPGSGTVTVLDFGSGIDAPVRIRIDETGGRCWMTHSDLEDATQPN